MSTNPTWYDVLDVDRGASTAQIRSAWKHAIDGLDPTDRRFRTLNDAAAALLDDASREEYDAGLSQPDQPDEPVGPVTVRVPDEDDARALAVAAAPKTTAETSAETTGETAAKVTTAAPRVPTIAGRWLIVLGVLAALAGTAAGISLSRSGGADTVTVANTNDSVNGADGNQPLNHDYVTQVEPEGAAALQAAKTAVVPVLSYDYRHMDASRQRAEAYLTDDYRQKYDQLFALIKQNAPGTKTIVRTNPPIDAGVTLVSPDRVEVLVFVDRPTTNKLHTKPIQYQDYVTMTMANVDGTWLVDDMQTTPAS